MSERILILGGARFHGYLLAKSLLEKDNKIYVLNRGNYRKNYPRGITHLIADRNDPLSLEEVLQGKNFDAIIDNNAYNAEQIKILSRIIGEKNNHLIFTSSSSIYLRQVSEYPLKENEATGLQEGLFHPKIIQYAKNKFNAEKIAQQKFQFSTILRFPDIFGEGDFTRKLNYFYEKLKRKEKIFLEKEIQKFNLIYVQDVIQAFERTILNSKCFGKIINISDPTPRDFNSFFTSVYGELYSKENLIFLPSLEVWNLPFQFPFSWSTLLDTSFSEKLFGRIKITPIEEWGPRTLEWEIRQNDKFNN